MLRWACLFVAWVGAVGAEPPKDHWAFKPVVRPTVPTLAEHPVDAFIRVKLAAEGLKPAPLATREQLLRRVTFGLTGLPPSPAELDAFLSDAAPDAWERVVERLLASPAYGERWARHWLDLVRYADSNGYEFDEPRPDAWRYRDYVIRAFNRDRPYDQFVREQLAGDEFAPHDPDALVATGFNLLGPDMTDASDQAQRRYNTLSDATDTTALAFMGLTMGCARCHDHKFEPLSQIDYFRLQAFFTPAVFRRDLAVSTPVQRQAHEQASQRYAMLTQEIRTAISALEDPVRRRLMDAKLGKLSPEAQAAHRTPAAQRTGGQQELVAETEKRIQVAASELTNALNAEQKSKLMALRERLKAFDHALPKALPVALGLTDQQGPTAKTYLLERGNLTSPTTEVQPGFPAIFHAEVPTFKTSANSTGRRRALAEWLTNPRHPLTARVLVNRVWQQHFGRGLVATTSDFGVRGSLPTHPELLDYLADEFVQRGWRIKDLHRLLLTSATYRQTVQADANTRQRDPTNQWFSHMNRHRLEGEAVRDALLQVSGQLQRQPHGPGVVLPELAAPTGGAKPLLATKDEQAQKCRTIYLFQRRNLRYTFLEALDLPDSNLSCPKRERSTTAPQALALLNSPLAVEVAKAFATRLQAETAELPQQVRLAYRYALSRWPTDIEQQRALRFLEAAPLRELCRALCNVNEFLYLD